MNISDLEELRKLSNSLDHGPSGLYDIESPRLKVLFVDDEEQACRVFKSYIGKKLEIDVYTATSSEGALRIMREHHDEIGVVVSDVCMPRRSGVWLINAIKQKWSDTICFLTTAYSPPTSSHPDASIADGHIPKPWDLDKLVRIINMSLLRAAT